MIESRHINKEFGSVRFVAFLTPDTFTRKIKVVSTTWRTPDYMGKGSGQTAIAQADTFNYFCIDITKLDYEVVKTHRSLKGALDYHLSVVNSSKFTDCEVVK